MVRAGGKIPVDGTVIEGEALVDAGLITGRSLPELLALQGQAFAGTHVEEGRIVMRADRVGEQTYLNRMLDLLEASLEQPSDTEKKADALARRLMRWGAVATAVTFVLVQSASRAFSVLLVMSCPCATVLAASTALAAAVARGARKGILIWGGRHLEALPSIDCACFDKTGTLTTRNLRVVDICPYGSKIRSQQLLALAAQAEGGSSHPLAQALREEAARQGIEFQSRAYTEVFIGRGVRARIGRTEVWVGSETSLREQGINTAPLRARVEAHAQQGRTVIFVAKNRMPIGIIALASEVRPKSADVLRRLRQDGVNHFCLLTGDAEPIARSIAEDLGFDEFRANLLPEEKVQWIEELKRAGRRVLMVGDGVNDALALSAAHVGVALGAGGSGVSVEASDVALARSDLEDLLALRLLARRTLRIVEQNFWIATGTNVLGIVAGMGGWMPPFLAGLLHMTHTVGILLNSSRLLRWEPRDV